MLTHKKTYILVSNYLQKPKKSSIENGIQSVELLDLLINLKEETKAYVIFHTIDGRVFYKLITLKKVAEETNLVRISKDCIINPLHLVKLNNRFKTVHIKNTDGKVLSLSVLNCYKKK